MFSNKGEVKVNYINNFETIYNINTYFDKLIKVLQLKIKIYKIKKSLYIFPLLYRFGYTYNLNFTFILPSNTEILSVDGSFFSSFFVSV